jgi:hypothetical protein
MRELAVGSEQLQVEISLANLARASSSLNDRAAYIDIFYTEAAHLLSILILVMGGVDLGYSLKI